MAFPTIPTAGAGRVLTTTQANTTATRTFPNLSSLTKNSGDLLVAIIVGYQSSLTSGIFSSWGAGFTEARDIGVSSQHCVGIAYKWSTGSETGTFTVTQGGTVTGHAAMILLSIPGAHASTAPEVLAALATGTSTAANPGSLSPSWGAEDTLWIAVRGSGETSTSGTFTGLGNPPSNYTDSAQTGISGDAVGGVEAGTSFRQLNAASEDVGAGTCDTSNARNCAIVIAVRPAAASDITITPDPVTIPLAIPTPAIYAGNPYSDEVMADSPVAYYRMGEASGDVVDALGGSPGSVSGSVTRDVAGGIADDDGAIDFPGTSGNYITVPDQAKLDLGDGPWTIECWARRDSSGTNYRVLVDRGVGGPDLYFDITTNKLQVELSGSTQNVNETGSTTDNNWHHWVVTRASGGPTTLYKDGVDVTNFLANPTYGATTGTLNIGGYRDGTSYPFDGAIDEVAIYNTELSSSRVAAHYAAGTGAADVTVTPGPVAIPLAIPTPTLVVDRVLTPSPVTMPLAVPAPTVGAGRIVAPSPVTMPLAVPAPTVTAGARVTPAPVTVPLVTPAPTLSVGRVITPSPVTIPLVIPAPTVAVPGTFYMAPGGSDSNDGSFGSPWATIQKFVDTNPAPGSTLYLRGGTYNPATDGCFTGEGFGDLIGTAGSPITIAAYPGETPEFPNATDPTITLRGNFTAGTIGVDHVVIDGLSFPGCNASNAAVVVVGNAGDPSEPLYLVKNVTIRNCYFSLATGTTSTDHCLGVVHGVENLTVEDCEFEGPGVPGDGGNGFVSYHTPAAINTVIQRCIFHAWNNIAAAQLWDEGTTPVATITVEHCTFFDNGNIDLDLRHHSTALVRSNVSDRPLTNNLPYDPNDSADTTTSHNYGSESLNADGSLQAGSAAIGGAHDGTDAGAIPFAAADVTVAPSPVTIPLVLPAPAITAGARVTPDPVSVSLVVATPTIVVSALVTPDPVAIPLAVPAPTVRAGVLVTPDPVSIALAVPSPSIVVSVLVSPSPVPVVFVLPAPAIDAGVPVPPGFLDELIELVVAGDIVTISAIDIQVAGLGVTSTLYALDVDPGDPIDLEVEG